MFSRRKWFGLCAALLPNSVAAQNPLVFSGKRPMLVHNDWPEDLETPPEYFDTWITPVEAFFVRQHLPRPKVDAASYRLSVVGMVAKPMQLTLADLRALPQYTVPATLECAGNGRANFRPRVAGLQWRKGAIGNAEWRGPRVADVLKKAGASTAAPFGSFNGADQGVGQTPDFIRSIPMSKLMHEATILALEMNGKPLTDLHGFPVRLIVPGWDGANWVKWVNEIRLGEMDTGFYMNPAYRMPKYPVRPGAAARPEDLEVIEGMPVVSFFTNPSEGAVVSKRTIALQGVAFAGENRVRSVEVSVDGGARWRPAQLSPQDYPFAWRLFRLDWTPTRPGYYVAMCRATDSSGRVQPIEPVWNPSGYLWNAVDRVHLIVEG